MERGKEEEAAVGIRGFRNTVEVLGNCTNRGDTVHHPHFDTNRMLGGVPKPPSVFITHEEDSQNSLKAVMFVGVVYCGGRRQFKLAERRCRGLTGSEYGASIVLCPWS